MTREEQIKAAAEKEVPSTYERDGVRYDSNMWQSHQRIFIKGAQWSDAHPCFGVVDPIGSERSGSGVKSNEPSATDEEAAYQYAKINDTPGDIPAFLAGRTTLRASLKGDLEKVKELVFSATRNFEQVTACDTPHTEHCRKCKSFPKLDEALSILARLLGEK